MMLASELYAASQGKVCKGRLFCHWCGAPCENTWAHDEPPPLPFKRSSSTASRPSEPFICYGCWLFRRQLITVDWFDGGYTDRRCPGDYGWWMTPDTAKAIHPVSGCATLYPSLLKPPTQFCLAILTSGQGPNFLHLAQANALPVIEATTDLAITVNNTHLSYSVYELEEGIRHGPEGKSPGVRALLQMFPPPAKLVKGLQDSDPQHRKGEGRQDTMEKKNLTRTVARSGDR